MNENDKGAAHHFPDSSAEVVRDHNRMIVVPILHGAERPLCISDVRNLPFRNRPIEDKIGCDVSRVINHPAHIGPFPT